ncbi:MAG: exodeoxyribonuclease VII large subunit, partial [Cellvibrionaceae bacterium]
MNDDLFDTAPTRDILSVSELNRKARQLLETHLSLLWVEGEISNFAAPSSGHWYFTLKDKDAQVRCAMFRNRNSLVGFKPALGKQVVVRGRVSLYEGRGDYQLIVEHVEEAGFGVLQRAFEALKT